MLGLRFKDDTLRIALFVLGAGSALLVVWLLSRRKGVRPALRPSRLLGTPAVR